MGRRDDGPLGDLLALAFKLPWEFGVIAGAALLIVGAVLQFVHPTDMGWNILRMVGSILCPLIGVAVLAVTGFGALTRWLKGRRFDAQTGIGSIRDLNWKEFEELLGVYYSRQGYAVDENEFAGPDGGFDLVLHKDGFKYLVQAKQWRTQSVGVSVVREMFGLMHSERAAEVIIVTSGSATPDAREFAAGKQIVIIEGPELEAMILSARTGAAPMPAAAPPIMPPPVRPPLPPLPATSAPVCPKCGKPLVRRTAHKGAHAGKDFWACPGYPACKYIQNIAP